MKILLLDNSSLTSVEEDYSIDPKTGSFAKELKELGNDVTLYGQKVESKDTIHSFKLKENGLKVGGLKRRKNKLINYLLLYIKIIPEIIKTDAVYVFYPTAFKFVPFICKLFRKKYGLYVRGEKGLDSNVSHWLYKNAYVVFTVSDYFTNIIKQITGKDNVHTIRPMISLTEKDIVFDRKYRLNKEVNILFLGRVTYDKGVKELLEGIKDLKQKGYNIKMNLVGSGEFFQEAIGITKKHDIEDVVLIKGAIFNTERIKNLYVSADLYILPTYHEGFPRTLYEAMIFGTPIITTFVGGIPGLMKNGYNCKEIKPKSVDSIVETIEYSICNYDKVASLAKNATKTIQAVLNSNKHTHAQQLNKELNKND